LTNEAAAFDPGFVGFWRAIASLWGIVVEKFGVVVEATAVDTVGAVESVY
jgi:hypothetical protein